MSRAVPIPKMPSPVEPPVEYVPMAPAERLRLEREKAGLRHLDAIESHKALMERAIAEFRATEGKNPVSVRTSDTCPKCRGEKKKRERMCAACRAKEICPQCGKVLGEGNVGYLHQDCYSLRSKQRKVEARKKIALAREVIP